ncbi:hypothetical protein [Spirosoma luteum]|uniref:hypothetical protein n=1 Tax=Spirosoma luteum TaxID=431553 RepID=UPI0003817AC1|nr:hypothetical protein [Spirosoma luteum]
MNRFSVLYLLKERHQHIICQTISEARSVLQTISTSKGRIPIGIYDAKTELFEWEPGQQHHHYTEAGINEQGNVDEQIITISQALRRRDASWQVKGSLQRPSIFCLT